jgi:chemotaxis protein methyltransferase CheR
MQELLTSWMTAGFIHADTGYVAQDAWRVARDVVRQERRRGLPTGVLLCRHGVLTYDTEPVQRDIQARLVVHLVPGGVLVVGVHAALPQDASP